MCVWTGVADVPFIAISFHRSLWTVIRCLYESSLPMTQLTAASLHAAFSSSDTEKLWRFSGVYCLFKRFRTPLNFQYVSQSFVWLLQGYRTTGLFCWKWSCSVSHLTPRECASVIIQAGQWSPISLKWSLLYFIYHNKKFPIRLVFDIWAYINSEGIILKSCGSSINEDTLKSFFWQKFAIP